METYNIVKDINEAQRMADVLPSYVLQQSVYYHIGNDLPRMTIGSLLLRTRRLHFFKEELSVKQQKVLAEIDRVHSQAIQEWHIHYIAKMMAEVNARLMMLERYLGDCEESPEHCQEFYRPEALRRTLIHELLENLNQLNVRDLRGIESRMSKLDNRLRILLKETDFLWDKVIEEAYPKSEYWWLYRQPVESKLPAH